MHPTIVLPAFAPDQPAARVDAALRQALSACDRAQECAVLWFAEVQRRALYREFGHASLEIYATESLGFTQNRYWQFKRLADDFERLPALKEAVATGELGWTKAQQVARVATPETQQEWVAKATTTGRRELAREVQAARAVVMAEARRAVAREEVPAPAVAPIEMTISLRGDALQVARLEALLEKARKVRRGAAGASRLELVIEALAEMVEGASAEAPAAAAPSRPGVQVVVQQCPDCAAATVATSRGELALAPAQVAAVGCDAVVREPARGGVNRSTIPPRVRAQVLARDRYRCSRAGCGATRFLEVHHLVPRAKGGGNGVGNLVTLCSRCHGFVHEERKAASDFQAPGR